MHITGLNLLLLLLLLLRFSRGIVHALCLFRASPIYIGTHILQIASRGYTLIKNNHNNAHPSSRWQQCIQSLIMYSAAAAAIIKCFSVCEQCVSVIYTSLTLGAPTDTLLVARSVDQPTDQL